MTSLVHNTNSYAKLTFKETEETENYKRKAQKKLREIETLKKKPTKTPEEWAKIHQENDWRAIVTPINISIEPTAEEVKERKEKQREKTKMKKLEKQLYDEKQKHKKEMELFKKHFYEQQSMKMKQLIADKTQIMEENRELKHGIQYLQKELKILKEKKSPSRQSTSSYYKAEDVSIEEKIEDEFHDLYSELQCYRKVYYKMMRDYHPDKCQKEISEPASKVLSILKEKYVK